MRHLILSLTIVGLLLAGCAPGVLIPPANTEQPTALPTASSSTDRPAGVRPAASWDNWNTYEAALRPAASQKIDPAGLTQYHLTVNLAPDLSALTGQAQIRYTNRESVSLDSVYLHLFPNLWGDGMAVSDVQVGDQPAAADLQAEDSLLRVPLPQPLPPNNRVALSLGFVVPIPTGEGIGNYGEFALQDGMLALAHFYPTVVVYDEKGWHLETPAPQGDVLYADASLYDVTLTAPAALTVVATGATLDQTDNGNGTATWHLAGGPMRDFNITASADYRSTSAQVDDVVVNSYYLPADTLGGKEVLDWATAALRTYETEFGPYPYRELDVAETATSAGGIEYPGMVVIASSLYEDPERRVFFESATAHEVSHQWWYNVVGNDQINAPWLDEALAQYSTYLYYLDQYGQAGGQEYLNAMNRRWDRVSHADVPIGLPVGAYHDREYGAIVYGRGPLFLTALRDQIGEDKMAEFLRRYYIDYAWGIVTPADFQALAETVSGQDLGALFEKWVYP